MKSNVCLFLLFLILINACTMAPKYKQPELPVSDQWNSKNDSIESDKLASNLKWQNFFTDPIMQEVITTALENNRNLKDATLKIEAARALYRIKSNDLWPKVNAEISGSRKQITEKSSSSGNANITSQYDANINASFELDLFGRIRSLNNAALEDFLAISETQKAIQISLIAEVANAYLQWLADKKIKNITEETIKTQTKSYELIFKSFESGIATKLDLLQARTTLETANVNVAIYARRVEQDVNALVLLMGVDKEKLFLSNQTLDEIRLMSNLPIGLPSTVLLVRPDVKATEHQLKSMNANIGAARAAFFPKISLTAEYGFSSSSLSSLFSGGAFGAWNFAPKLTAPIFEGKGNMASLRHAKVKKEIAVVQYEKAIQVAFREIKDELVAREYLHAQLEAQKKLIQTAQETYDLANARFNNGVIRFINVLDSERTLFNAKQNAVEVEKLRLSNLVNLYKVLGGGWEQELIQIKVIESQTHSHPH